MKQLLFLLLFPCFAIAQYQGNGNQKITLGEQTTADGLVYRGLASIDTVTATSKITRANKQDTSAYILLDTVTNLLWHYKIGSNGWIQAGGGVSVSSFSGGTTGLTPSTATTGAVTLGGTLAVANGGTGSTTQNFVDLTTTQSIGGTKTYTSETRVNNNFRVNSKTLFVDATLNRVAIGHDTSNAPFYKLDIRDTANLNLSSLYTGTGTTGTSSLAIQTQSNNAFLDGRYIAINQYAVTNTGTKFGDSKAGMAVIEAYQPSVLMIGTDNSSPIKFATNNTVKAQITSGGEVWIGYTTDQGAYPLQVNGQIFATNATIATSDKKFKENVTPLSKGLEIVSKLKPVTFNFINDTENNFSEYEEVGFIAQDVDRALSNETFSKSIVKAANDSEPTSTMGLATQNLIPILVKAIQEQQALIKALEQRIINLENK